LRHHPKLRRSFAVSTLVVVGLTVAGTRPVVAEFEIQEAEIEKGEIEIEYRGAYHWGVPNVAEGADEFGFEVNNTVQSHELEWQMGITNWWMISAVAGFDQPLGEDLQASSVEIETQFGLIRRDGNGVDVSAGAGKGDGASKAGEASAHDRDGLGLFASSAVSALRRAHAHPHRSNT
jgi:hypothetical protein